MVIRRMLAGATVVSALLLGAAPAAMASSAGPGEGPEFGTHVSDMAPAHPLLHGRHFGECVSGMAQGQCPHPG
jgi:hypothetical protein